MKIETLTKYRCDGCGHEQTAPHGWQSLVPLMVSGMAVSMVAGSTYACDYCATCIETMRASVKRC